MLHFPVNICVTGIYIVYLQCVYDFHGRCISLFSDLLVDQSKSCIHTWYTIYNRKMTGCLQTFGGHGIYTEWSLIHTVVNTHPQHAVSLSHCPRRQPVQVVRVVYQTYAVFPTHPGVRLWWHVQVKLCSTPPVSQKHKLWNAKVDLLKNTAVIHYLLIHNTLTTFIITKAIPWYVKSTTFNCKLLINVQGCF